jgi:hypothetical protein
MSKEKSAVDFDQAVERPERPRPTLVEMLDEHDVTGWRLRLSVEDLAPVRRDRQAIIELLLGFEDLTDLFGGEIEIVEGLD